MPNEDKPNVLDDQTPTRESFPVNDILDRVFDDNEDLKPAPTTASDDSIGDDTVADDDHLDDAGDLTLDDVEGTIDLPDKGSDEIDFESDPTDETMARKQAKERGREAKRLKLELEQARLKLKETEDQAKQLQTRMSEVESSVVDPESHPDYRSLLVEMRTDVSRSAEVLDVEDPSLVVSNFGPLMKAYIDLEGLEGKERSEGLLAIKGLIVDNIIKADVPYAEMTPEERSAHSSVVSEVLRIVQRNRSNVSKLNTLKETLSDQAKKGVLSRGSRAYEAAVGELRPVVDAVGTLTDELVQADPFSPSALVSRLAKNPDNKEKIEKAKQEVIEVLVGPSALTPEQVKTLESNGTDVKEFLAERERRIAARRKALAPLLVEAILTRAITKKALKALLDKGDASKSSAKEVAALRSVGKRTAPPPKKEEKRPLFDRLFDDSEELR
jgi:hypothetical protein